MSTLTHPMFGQLAQIEPHLFLGSQYATNPETLRTFGITHIFHFGFELETDSVSHEYFPLEDNSQSVQQMMDIGKHLVTKIDTVIEQEKKTVLVCCVAGRSRSASMIALYLHHKYPTLSYDEIIARINQKRNIAIIQAFGDAIREKIKEDTAFLSLPFSSPV